MANEHKYPLDTLVGYMANQPCSNLCWTNVTLVSQAKAMQTLVLGYAKVVPSQLPLVPPKGEFRIRIDS